MRNLAATVENVTNIEGAVVIPFTVLGQENTKLMDMLSDKVYKDSALAVIREYTTNALDSHIASGQTRPVEITSPSRMYPFFVVQDYGVGLDLEDMKNIYTQYIVSTKEDNDDETGNLGIGSKAALGYVGQYTVATVKNGQKIVGIVTRNELGNPVMICEVSETDEPNGVKVTVPVNTDFDGFNHKIKHFHKFLKPGLLLVDGQDADRSQFQSIGPNMEINYHLDHDYIVMGSVAYPVDKSLFSKLYSRSIVTYVEMGEVQFTQSREEMNYTARTKNTLEKYREQFNTNIFEYMTKAIEACENRRLAYNMQYEFLWNSVFKASDPFMYKGKQLPDNFSQYRNRTNPDTIMYAKYEWGRNYDTYCRKIVEGTNLTTLEDKILYVKNWTNLRFTRVQADKIDHYLSQNGLQLPTQQKYAVFVNKVDPELLEGLMVIDWEEVKQVKVPGRTTVTKKARHYYGVADGGTYKEYVPDVNKPVWWAIRSQITTARYPSFTNLLKPWNNPGEQFVFVTQGGKDRFLKDYPHAQHFRQLYHVEYEEYLKSLTDEDLKVFSNVGRVSCGNVLIADKVLDPELKAAVMFTQNLITDAEKDTLAKYDASRKIAAKCSYEFLQKMDKAYTIPKTVGTKHELHEKYPLLERVYHTLDTKVREHLTDYVNIIYKKGE